MFYHTHEHGEKIMEKNCFTIYCPDCKEEHYTDEVKFEGVEEGPMGEDRMIFRCPESGKVHTSTVYGRRITK